jgi:hypothetical protein
MKDESWVALKDHFVLDIVQPALRARHFMSSATSTQAIPLWMPLKVQDRSDVDGLVTSLSYY